MTRFHGKVGFSVTEETSPGVWVEQVIEKPFYGDVTRNSRRWQSGEHLNDDLKINNEVSILASSWMLDHIQGIRYVVYAGTRWKVSDISIEYPRIVLNIGEAYNGPEAEEDG